MEKCRCLCHDKESETHSAAYQRNCCWCYGCDGCRELGLEVVAHYKPTSKQPLTNQHPRQKGKKKHYLIKS